VLALQWELQEKSCKCELLSVTLISKEKEQPPLFKVKKMKPMVFSIGFKCFLRKGKVIDLRSAIEKKKPTHDIMVAV